MMELYLRLLQKLTSLDHLHEVALGYTLTTAEEAAIKAIEEEEKRIRNQLTEVEARSIESMKTYDETQGPGGNPFVP